MIAIVTAFMLAAASSTTVEDIEDLNGDEIEAYLEDEDDFEIAFDSSILDDIDAELLASESESED